MSVPPATLTLVWSLSSTRHGNLGRYDEREYAMAAGDSVRGRTVTWMQRADGAFIESTHPWEDVLTVREVGG